MFSRSSGSHTTWNANHEYTMTTQFHQESKICEDLPSSGTSPTCLISQTELCETGLPSWSSVDSSCRSLQLSRESQILRQQNYWVHVSLNPVSFLSMRSWCATWVCGTSNQNTFFRTWSRALKTLSIIDAQKTIVKDNSKGGLSVPYCSHQRAVLKQAIWTLIDLQSNHRLLWSTHW